MALAAGTRLGPYEILAPLGAGGMGEVYRARDRKLGHDVAIKALPPGDSFDPDRAARFEREAQVLASLNHPNIAIIHGLVEAGNASFIVMELVDGESLAARIEAGPISVADALAIARQIADALQTVHLKGIVHRDLKPANVMVTADGRVKVLDFGLAKTEIVGGVDTAMSPTFTSAGTQLGVILGTAAYMAPEQAKGKAVDKRADVWAFGCTLYEMLTGHRAFAGDDMTEIVATIMRDAPDWSRLPPGLPPVADRYLRRSLEKNPNDRVQDLGDMRLALDGAFDVTAAIPVKAQRTPIPMLAAIVLTAAVVGAGVWALKPSPREILAPLRRLPITLAPALAAANTNRDFAISPDGMTIVYMANSASGRTMFARRLDSLDSSPLRRIDRAFEPFFSADGKWIGYNDEADFDLRKISITGEPPALITHVGREIRGAAWSSQDVIVFATEEGLFRVPPSGGTPVVVSKPDSARGERSYSWPEWLPGGKTILFSLERDSGPTAIATVPVSGGAPKVIIKDGTSPKWLPTGHLLYLAADGVLRGVPFDADALEVRGEAVPLAEAVDTKAAGAANAALSADGTLLYAPASHFAHRRLVWVDRASGARSVLPAPVRGYVLARISPDGTRIAVDVREHSQAVYIYDIARDALDKFTDSSALDGFPVWTPDSSQIVFASTRLGRRGLFVQRVDRGGTARPLFPAGIDSPTSVTPDGQDVLFQREVGEDPKTGVDIIIGPLAGGSAKPLRSMIANEVNGEVSADGRWLAYESNEADKDLAQIYVRPFPNVEAERHLVSTADGRYPAWRADSHELFYVSPEGKIMSVAIGPGPKFSASPARVLISAPIQTQTVLRSYDVTPDGRRFLVIEDASGEATTPLTLLLNIAEALKHPSRR